ncbi:MAG TPA: NAD(P)/FAD-dependent oxidoreductase [Nitrospirae bacterium]|nr:putative oxidoreductase/MT0587 [bacterium BMS3Abin10]GBE38836.1 putative oxidoreductase/MT0587 [bacterium BMS3Bbin08]HDH50501.1 NAD(P)/FAD-dependent oxidoreductase [Nitrospirota bacterium]HDK81334.1 NAD(P)/FAD-dependent oxidoreductase [Nitrospirota bacterium]
MQNYDVAIIGGSCAGAASGYTLAKAGRKTVIIDKAVFPRKKVCGGMITEKTVALLQQVYDHTPVEPVIDSAYAAYSIYYAGPEKICTYTHPSNRLYSVDRAVFDNYFLQKAAAAGCDIISGQKAVGIQGNTITFSSGEMVRAGHIIGADGAHSIVRRSLYPEIRKRHFAMGLEVDVGYEGLKCFDNGEDICPQIYFGIMNSGYGWVFPRKDHATVGIGGVLRFNKDNIRNLFISFLKKVARGSIDPLLSKIAGFPVPLHNYVKKPARDNVFLAGDAAGFVEPVSGEGIYFAVLSGRFAAESIIAGGNSADKYNHLIQKHIHRLFKQAYFVKRILFWPGVLSYTMSRMSKDIRYAKLYYDLISGEIDYIQYTKNLMRKRK